jgi:hypothetical protein
MRDTKYAREIASADIGGERIERIFVKESGEEEIRFSWWKDGRFAPRPLDLPERDLLDLMRQAMANGVFTDDFLDGLRDAIVNRKKVGAT